MVILAQGISIDVRMCRFPVVCRLIWWERAATVRRKRISGMMGMSLSRVARYCFEQDGKWGSHGHPVVVVFFLTDSEEICGGFSFCFMDVKSIMWRVLNSSLRVRRCFAGSSWVLPSLKMQVLPFHPDMAPGCTRRVSLQFERCVNVILNTAWEMLQIVADGMSVALYTSC